MSELIDSTIRHVHHLVSRFDLTSVDRCADRLASLDIRSILEACIDPDADELIAQVQAESYTHANGFDRISLPAAPGARARLRIHIWPSPTSPETRADLPDAHNHKWPFASRVLVGTLSNELVRPTLRASGRYTHYKHIDMVAGYRFAEAGRADLEVIGVEMTRAEETYAMFPEPVHRVPRPPIYTATIVAELEPRTTMTDVFVAARPKEMGRMLIPPRFGTDELRAKLVTLWTRLHEDSA